MQQKSLAKAHKLLENGWGLNLGEFEEQQTELAGELTLVAIEVRFFPPVITFILEGERRHVNQKIIPGPKDSKTGQLAYVTYKIQLPPRSLSEFNLWIFRHLNNAQVISPPELVEFHRQSVQALMQRYS